MLTTSGTNARATSLSLLVGATVVLGLLGGCGKKPGGQVIAVVNGEEITQQEVRAEAEAAGVRPGQDFQSYAPIILDRVIQRNLLVDYAKQKGLDRGPAFVARRRQLEQALLANLAMRQIVASLPAPTASDISGFIAHNPAMFAGREKLTLDQVRFPAPSDMKQIKTLDSLGSIDAVLTQLKGQGIPVQRASPTLDTGTVDAAVGRQIAALKNGQLFDLTINGMTYISAITARTPVAASSATWQPAAAEALQRERAQKALADDMARMRGSAKIQYDPGYKPQAGSAAGAAPLQNAG